MPHSPILRPELDDDRRSTSHPNVNASYRSYPEMIYDHSLSEHVLNPALQFEKRVERSKPKDLESKHVAIASDPSTNAPPPSLPLPDHFESPYYDLSLGHDAPSPEYPFGRLRCPIYGRRSLWEKRPATFYDPSKSPNYDPSLGFRPSADGHPGGRHRCTYLNKLTAETGRNPTNAEIHQLLEVRGLITKNRLHERVSSLENIIKSRTAYEEPHHYRLSPWSSLIASSPEDGIEIEPRTRMEHLTDSAEALGGYALHEEIESRDLRHNNTLSGGWDSDDSWSIFMLEMAKEGNIRGDESPEVLLPDIDIDASLKDPVTETLKRKSQDVLKMMKTKAFG